MCSALLHGLGGNTGLCCCDIRDGIPWGLLEWWYLRVVIREKIMGINVISCKLLSDTKGSVPDVELTEYTYEFPLNYKPT